MYAGAESLECRDCGRIHSLIRTVAAHLVGCGDLRCVPCGAVCTAVSPLYTEPVPLACRARSFAARYVVVDHLFVRSYVTTLDPDMRKHRLTGPGRLHIGPSFIIPGYFTRWSSKFS